MSAYGTGKSHRKQKNPFRIKLGDRLRNLREDRDLRQRDIAELLQLERSTYAHYEAGDTEPDCQALMKLAEFYHITLDDLMRS